MHVDTQRCLQCGSRYRKNLESCFGLNYDGSFLDSEYWFCTVECYKKAVNPFIADQEIGFDKTAFDEPEVMERLKDMAAAEVDYNTPTLERLTNIKIGEYEIAWEMLQSENISKAETELMNRVEAEANHLAEQKAEKEHEAQLKLEERQAELDRKQSEKEEEQERKRSEKEQAIEAEEAKWRPRPFKV